MYIPGKSFINQLDRCTLLRMREEGMSNREIAANIGCSYNSIHRLIGPQPKEMSLENRSKAIRSRVSSANTAKPEEAEVTSVDVNPFKAVLAVKFVAPQPIPLHGYFMDYCISADRQMIDVETAGGRCLMQIPVDKLDTFIDELNAIKRNINTENPSPFWG